MRELVIDCEANGLSPTTIWCVVVYDLTNHKFYEFYNNTLTNFKEFIQDDDIVIGHNFLSYDAPAFKKLLGVKLKVKNIRDTLILSRLWDITLDGGHSLEVWGKRFKTVKPVHTDWSQFSNEMLVRCKEDVKINVKVYNFLKNKLDDTPDNVIFLEHYTQWVLNNMTDYGAPLRYNKTNELYLKLYNRYEELQQQLIKAFPRKVVSQGIIKPKYKKNGELSKVGLKFLGDDWVNVEGDFTRISFEAFNPSSPKQIVERLNDAGWKPIEKTKGYKDLNKKYISKQITKEEYENRKNISWKISETNLETIPKDAPQEAHDIAEYLMLQARWKVVKAWLDLANETGDNRVHGSVIGLGAKTHRCTHNKPNMANVPSIKAPYGKECRECIGYEDEDNRVLVGVDASSIQMRIFSHWVGDPSYIKEVIDGDIHTRNMIAAGIEKGELQEDGKYEGRAKAKTFIYAFLLGAGNQKIEDITGQPGQQVKDKFTKNIPGFQRVQDLMSQFAYQGYLINIDNRKIPITYEHLGLSVALQAGEATIMKHALVEAYKKVMRLGYDAHPCLFVHDEIQWDCDKEIANEVLNIQVEEIKKAGEFYNLKVPMDAEGTIGSNWSKTH